jgi:hypothetical protein
MRLLFGEWTPDVPPSLSEGLQVATGVYPMANGYRPAKQFVLANTAMGGACKGASAFVSPQGSSAIIAGSATNLYRAFAGGWQSIGSGYSLQTGGRWRFAQFGGLAIATNEADPLQKIDLNTGVTAALDGSPPKAKLLAVVKDFLVGGVIDGDVMQLRWSGINNAEWWTIAQRQSDYQVMPTGGEINGIIGGEFGLILQRNRISRMDYVGGNTIFTFNEISTNIGCVSVHSVIQSGQLAFWRSDHGFIMWDGANLKQIGNEKIDRYFDSLYANADWANASTAVDAKNTLVIWSMGDAMFVYNWSLEKWTMLAQASEIIFSGVTPATSLDELDQIYGDLDSVSTTIDDPAFLGGDPRFYVFSTSHTMGTLTGANMAATLTFGDIEFKGGREARLFRARPLTDAVANLTLTVGARARLGDSVSNRSYTTLTASGDMPIRERGRYLRPSLVHAAGATWTYSQGLEMVGAAGMRK